jgi:hypothetical protein
MKNDTHYRVDCGVVWVGRVCHVTQAQTGTGFSPYISGG